MKVKLVVILAIATIACSERSFPYTHHPSDVKSLAQAGSAASEAKQFTPAAQGDPRPSPDNGTVVVQFQFQAPELDPSLAEYLSLTSHQISAMQRLLWQQRREIGGLKTQLRSTHGKLVLASEQGQEKEIRALAAAEARILTKLITKSLRAQARLHAILTHEQQRKLEDLNRFVQP